MKKVSNKKLATSLSKVLSGVYLRDPSIKIAMWALIHLSKKDAEEVLSSALDKMKTSCMKGLLRTKWVD